MGETISDVVYKNNPAKEGFEQVASKIGGNQGIDGLYFKYAKNADGSHILDEFGDRVVEAIDIVEAKYGTSSLNYVKAGFKQMDDDWIEYCIDRMRLSADDAVVEAGELLFEASQNGSDVIITKYLDNIVKETGEVVTQQLDALGNLIN